MTILVLALFLILFSVNGIFALLFLTRQILFSFLTLGRPQENPFSQADIQDWPSVTVVVPAHNEERVIGGCLQSLTQIDYPKSKLEILVINDRSKDNTQRIVDSYVAANAHFTALHRRDGAIPGKPAALMDALAQIGSEIVIFFDADYLPEPPLLKKLVAPFIDPQVGATMGRVVPYNTQTNLLTRLLDLERRGGYTIDQAARGLLGLLPQFGGTVGGVRMSAMKEVGGWSSETLAEDTDLTYRLFCAGYTVEYVDDALCYEESPVLASVRYKQIRRWACGHNQCLFRYLGRTLTTPHQRLLSRLDASLVLLFFVFPPMSLISLIAAIVYPTLFPASPPFNFAVISALSFVVGFGNFAPYFQIVAAIVRDRQPGAITMLPLLFLSSALSMLAAMQGFLFAARGALFDIHLGWDKTVRFRETSHVS